MNVASPEKRCVMGKAHTTLPSRSHFLRRQRRATCVACVNPPLESTWQGVDVLCATAELQDGQRGCDFHSNWPRELAGQTVYYSWRHKGAAHTTRRNIMLGILQHAAKVTRTDIVRAHSAKVCQPGLYMRMLEPGLAEQPFLQKQLGEQGASP